MYIGEIKHNLVFRIKYNLSNDPFLQGSMRNINDIMNENSFQSVKSHHLGHVV